MTKRSKRDDRKEFAARLFNVLVDLEITQAEAAARCGLDQTFISALVNARRWPSIPNLIRLCDGLGTNPSALLGYDFEI